MTINIEKISPVLKWAGGKSQIMKHIYKHFPKKMNNYYELFIGGGSVFLELLKRLEEKTVEVEGDIILNDKNKYLIYLYKSIKENPEEFINKVEEYKSNLNKAEFIKRIAKVNKLEKLDYDNLTLEDVTKKSQEYVYYHYRNRFNKEELTEIEYGAMFLFINKTCWRGLYREGPNGFNVPYGNNKNASIFNREQIETLSELFNKYNVKFINGEYDSFNNFKVNDFVYMDPPYYPLNEKSFIKYQRDGFTKDNFETLNTFCRDLSFVKFIHSNSKCDYILESYKDFNIDIVECKRRINSKKPQDSAKEVIIFN